MNETLTGFMTALWLGILTSISPCPLTTNIAAVSYLSKKIKHQNIVFWSGIFYTLGRVTTYAVLGSVIISSLVSVPAIAIFLQKYMNKILGPLLLVTGFYLIGLLKFQFTSRHISDARQKRLANSGLGGAFILGVLFALSFCPISAALFFGSLIPVAIGHKFGITLPLIYGIGTALPVIIFALAISFGVTSAFKWFGHVAKVEVYARKITGLIFVLAGIYYVLAHIFYII